jgi:hypothetical protein
MLFDWDGHRVFGHDGGTVGQISSLRVLPEERFAAAILTNSIGGGLLTGRIMRWLFESVSVAVPPLPKLPEKPAELDLEPYTGVYERHGFRVTISLEGGQLRQLTESTGELDLPFPPQPTTLVPVDESLFLFQDPFTRTVQHVTFSDFRNGRPEYHHSGRTDRRSS